MSDKSKILFVGTESGIFYYEPGDVIEYSTENGRPFIELKVAYRVDMQVVVLPTSSRIGPGVTVQGINLVNILHNVKLSYSSSGEVPDDSVIGKAIEESKGSGVIVQPKMM